MKNNIPAYVRKQRNDWGDIKPITKIVPNKKKNPKIKHKKSIDKDYDM